MNLRTLSFSGFLLGILPLVWAVAAPGWAQSPFEAVVGSWVSQEADRHPLVFEKDGAFKYGFDKQGGAWTMAVGTYTISDEGKIKATAKAKGVSLGLHFTLKGDTVFGPRGPNPRVEWKKVK